MARHIFKSILLGILIGGLFFMMPFFILKFLFFFLIIGAICKLWWGGRRWGRWQPQHYQVYTDKIRNMSDEEYATFKTKMQNNNCGYGYHNSCGNYYNHGCNDWNNGCNDWNNKNQSTKTHDNKTENKNESDNIQQP
jgi:hypothetical protein